MPGLKKSLKRTRSYGNGQKKMTLTQWLESREKIVSLKRIDPLFQR